MGRISRRLISAPVSPRVARLETSLGLLDATTSVKGYARKIGLVAFIVGCDSSGVTLYEGRACDDATGGRPKPG